MLNIYHPQSADQISPAANRACGWVSYVGICSLIFCCRNLQSFFACGAISSDNYKIELTFQFGAAEMQVTSCWGWAMCNQAWVMGSLVFPVHMRVWACLSQLYAHVARLLRGAGKATVWMPSACETGQC